MTTIKGVVIKGQQLGRRLNFPTANVALDASTESIDSGVYISKIRLDERNMWFDSITNIGTNPTVDGVSKRSESYIFDFSDDIYDQNVTIILGDKLRAEMRFASVETLQQQISKDVAQAKQRLSNGE